MCSKHNDAKGAAKVYQVMLPEHRAGQTRLLQTVFKDRCKKCSLPSYVEIETLPKVDSPKLRQPFGLACGFWLARKKFAELLCAEFEGQFDLRPISDDAYFLILKNVLVPDDPFYESDIGHDPSIYFGNKERVCSLCGKPYIFLHRGFINFKGGNRIQPRTIYETSLKFGQADVKYPVYFCDEEASCALRAISNRKIKFVRSPVKFSVDPA